MSTLHPKAEINLIYTHTHVDYRSNSFGVKKIMYCSTEDRGATVLCPIDDLPDDVYADKLAYAKACEARITTGA